MKELRRIASFDVNHDVLVPGMYISRIDGDVVTYDLRFIKPNTPPFMSVEAAHTIEHLFATFVRNSQFGSEVVYFGPMGCMTGFYLLLRNTVSYEDAITLVRDALDFVALSGGHSYDHSYIPGNSRIECGNYLAHDLYGACKLANKMRVVMENWSVAKLSYRPLVLIQGAMMVEIADLLKKRNDFKKVVINDFVFYVSDGLVISLTGIGMTNATIATTIAINHFHPSYIINQGTAGAHLPEMHVGDFVVAEKSVNININFGSDDAEIPLDNQFKFFDGDKDLVKRLSTGGDGIRIFTGILGSGDLFSRNENQINRLRNMYGEIAEEMECAGVYEVCKHFGVPCAGIRVISNNEITKEAYQPDVASRLQDYLYNLLFD
ncbi:MAG: hypothetical protein E7385_02650 [Ruminococcaceae bacterium]|nr:hypothetical protein [Oscillospiraceae bacterium]